MIYLLVLVISGFYLYFEFWMYLIMKYLVNSQNILLCVLSFFGIDFKKFDEI